MDPNFPDTSTYPVDLSALNSYESIVIKALDCSPNNVYYSDGIWQGTFVVGTSTTVPLPVPESQFAACGLYSMDFYSNPASDFVDAQPKQIVVSPTMDSQISEYELFFIFTADDFVGDLDYSLIS